MLAGSYPDRTVRYLLDVLLIGWKIHLSYFFYFFLKVIFWGLGRTVSKCPSFLRSQPGRVYWKLLWWLATYTMCFHVVLPKWTGACWQSAYCPGMGILQCGPAHAVPPSWLSIRVGDSACRKPDSAAWRADLETYLCACVIRRRSPG